MREFCYLFYRTRKPVLASGPLDEGQFGAGSEDRTHTSWLEAKHAPQYAMPALIWRRVESTILTGEPADRLAGDAGHPPS
jgi:hypothetical protein